MPLWLVATCAAFVSAAVTVWWIRHARSHRVLDAPERRRLHTTPTPRGGGIGPVLAIILVLIWNAMHATRADARFTWTLCFGVLIVALISFIDDHRPLPIALRLVVQSFAAITTSVAFVISMPASPWSMALIGLVLVFAIVAVMNLHNFMDGSDAHLCSQTLFVFITLAILSFRHGDSMLGRFAIAVAAAVAGFLPFNWPRARVFLGDVGSITLGFLIAATSLLAIWRGVIGLGGALVLSSTFMIDAAATLIRRMHRTRTWLRPHRDHLYQWLRRRGFGAAGVVVLYQLWNLVVVVPAVAWLASSEPSFWQEAAVVAVVVGLSLGAWSTARRALWRAHRAQYRP